MILAPAQAGWAIGLNPASLTFRFRLTPGIMLQSLAFAVGMGLLGGLLPSLKAARLPLLEALRAP